MACEFSGVVRNAFSDRGHDAWSCDLLPSESPGNHFQADIMSVLGDDGGATWDLMIAHPPCTYLAASGARWWKDRQQEQRDALFFVLNLMNSSVPRVCIENPVGRISSAFRKPNQIIQPWQFGHGETKSTCLWMKNLPLLTPTQIVEGRHGRVWREPPSPERWKNRSRTLPGIAAAMAEQWGAVHV